ncbi:triphosphoribosyl-dephospho-CoA synthase CitG [Clostridium perfringens]|nr:triphosphoribosyl-dephospho-CoA synthase CitG [Clostridium perfringens]
MNINQEVFLEKLNSLIIKSLLYEVSCYPSPGLVSPISNGAHNDMDYYTFLDSISVIGPKFREIAEISMSDIQVSELLNKIRPIGLKIEEAMFHVTNNINTHKGLIFLMGVVCAATSKAFYEGKPFKEIRNLIKEMTSGLVSKELNSKTNKKSETYGEKIFRLYGITGIRGEVEKGLPSVFNYSLPFYMEHENLKTNERLYLTLLCIMANCEDSTLLHRNDIYVLEEVKKRSQEILNMICYEKPEIIEEKIFEIDKEFSERGISPGGSADLLAITVFLDGIKKYFPL